MKARVQKLDSLLTNALKENIKLASSIQACLIDKEDLLRQLSAVKNELTVAKDEIHVLNRRVEIMALGYRVNRQFVIEILSTKNGIDDASPEFVELDEPNNEGSG